MANRWILTGRAKNRKDIKSKPDNKPIMERKKALKKTNDKLPEEVLDQDKDYITYKRLKKDMERR